MYQLTYDSSHHPRSGLQDHDQAQDEASKQDKLEELLTKIEQIRDGQLNPSDLSSAHSRCMWNRLKTALGQPNPESEKANAVWTDIVSSGPGKDAKKKMLLKSWLMS